jgi:protein-arginine deiminase
MRSVGLFSLLVLAACSSTSSDGASPTASTEPAHPPVVADLRADSNRDGEVSFDARDAEKLAWDGAHGAVFLANIDDDSRRCKVTGSDVDLPKCNDAADAKINGPEDAKDLARLLTRPWAEAPEDATAAVGFADGASPPVRLFKRIGPEATDFEVLAEDGALALAELRAGVELAIEATDIVRDPKTWDGYVVVRLTVTAYGETVTDDVKLRVAPVLTSHHLQPAEELFVSDTGSPGNRAMRTDLAAACSAASAPTPVAVEEEDSWTQDFFETAWMSMPAAGGAQHVIRVNLRSANVFDPSDKVNPLRPAGQYVFTSLRGPDSAGIQQFDPRHDPRTDSLNSFGNLETIPPYSLGGEAYPFGRILRGAIPSFKPDTSFTKMLEAQSVQPPVYIDTSWLLVGHVDETISFVKASSPRGWVVLVNDARMAKSMLEGFVAKGHGETLMFAGKSWFDDRGQASPAQRTIAEVLKDTDVMTASAEAAAEVDAQVTILKKELGLSDDEIVRVPYLHHAVDGGSVAYQPGTVNGLYASEGHFIAPKPHGPKIDGVDPFETQLQGALAKHGVTVHFAEDWDDYHAALGEVHCGTNAARKIPDAKWWESGR